MYVYDFDQADSNDTARLGGKGAGLARMTAIGLPVPLGFTISTEVCRAVLDGDGLDDAVWGEIVAAISRLEERTGRRLGTDSGTPLLLSVRSGGAISMPGMMDTVLNLGLNDRVVPALAEWSDNEHFAWDAYRRFVQTYADVVLGVDGARFEQILTTLRAETGAADDSALAARDLETATRQFQDHVITSGASISDDPMVQLRSAIEAVFTSWNNPRAIHYRSISGIPEDMGTACTVQMMVFGDLGEDSGTGVCFTRDPSTGQRIPYGDYLPRAQGEDVVAGIRNTLSLDSLASQHPAVKDQLDKLIETLEQTYTDMCDIEFTVEKGRLWVLQARAGKRTAAAALRIASEMVDEGLIDRNTALLRIDPASLDQLLHPSVDDDAEGHHPLAVGLNASPGSAVGAAVFSADTALEWSMTGEPLILCRRETNPADIHGMTVAAGILTSHGGKTSHAAVVARGMGIPAVTGVADLEIDEDSRTLTVGDTVIHEGDMITIDGASGSVYAGELQQTDSGPPPELDRFLEWADEVRTMSVLANADTGADAAEAREWGAEGIGLARTEHMFLGDRLPIVRTIILEEPGAEEALSRLEAVQTEDFVSLLEAMDGLPVIVRLLDPPLHEFLPDRWELDQDRREALAEGKPVDEIDRISAVVARLEEHNPMLGMRGVRLGITRPHLYLAQVKAAVAAVRRRVADGGNPVLEIMVPLVSIPEELGRVRRMITAEIEAAELTVEVKIGTMIEIPRAALIAGDIAVEADFFSFGTNDLTQTTYAFSRDDAEGLFLQDYLAEGILTTNPFETLDTRGVGRLIRIAVDEGREAKPGLEVGICGEHGGDPASIEFCHNAGLDYVSCSPPRVPVARLAAARAALMA